MTQLADRFARGSDRPPLSALGSADRRELEALLRSVAAFEDLPGRWQAALLAVETPSTGAAPERHCCGGH